MQDPGKPWMLRRKDGERWPALLDEYEATIDALREQLAAVTEERDTERGYKVANLIDCNELMEALKARAEAAETALAAAGDRDEAFLTWVQVWSEERESLLTALAAVEGLALLADEARELFYEPLFGSTPRRIEAEENWRARYDALSTKKET